MSAEAELRRRFLRLLEEDEEFRYAVAGYLGLSEIIRRLDRMEAEQAKMRADFNRMQEEIVRLRADFNRMIEYFEKRFENLERRLSQVEKRLSGIEDRVSHMDRRLTRVERTLEKLTLDIEEEARSFVAHRLRQMGIEIAIGSLVLPDLELNIYGATDELCVLGEARVRAGPSALRELKRKIGELEKKYPGLLRPKRILLIYTSLATPELVAEAEEEGIWILKATGDIVPLRLPGRGGA